MSFSDCYTLLSLLSSLKKLVKNLPTTPQIKAHPIIIFNSLGLNIVLNVSNANRPPDVTKTPTASIESPICLHFFGVGL